ncbi:hypothetical protein ACWGB8_14320 [Kitasatospora sp. NPDC054939]
MSNPYQTPPGPYGGPGAQPHAPYGAPQYPQQPQGYPQQPYQQPQAPVVHQQPVHYPVAARPADNQYAMAAVVLGFVAVVTTCFYGGFLGLVGIGISIAGLNRSNATGTGRGMSIGALVLNVLAVLISAALVVLVLRGEY